MPVSLGSNAPSSNPVEPPKSPTGIVQLRRHWYVIKDGVQIEITSPEVLDAILAQMTPEEQENFKNGYRFAPVQNLTGNMNYMGTNRDLH
jgi:hypothetical protein